MKDDLHGMLLYIELIDIYFTTPGLKYDFNFLSIVIIVYRKRETVSMGTRSNSVVYQRRSIRLKGYDYSQRGAYFITICTLHRELYFLTYPELNGIVRQRWEKLTERFTNLFLDEFTIMPNHIHGIFIVGAGLAPALSYRATARVAPTWFVENPAPTVGEIVGTFKSLCIHDWLTYIKEKKIEAVGKFWQRNYYEHVIRNQYELNKIREYVQNNPLKWDLDKENPERSGVDVLEEEVFQT